ncbi:hypothetical protein C0J52_05639 [Blattella germanica]|nr:hypothetical protein C0J52_05639 [Blattella germanica]
MKVLKSMPTIMIDAPALFVSGTGDDSSYVPLSYFFMLFTLCMGQLFIRFMEVVPVTLTANIDSILIKRDLVKKLLK